MPLRHYTCPVCGELKRTLKDVVPDHCGQAMKEELQAPAAKMLETIDKETGKTRLKDQMKILKERTRNYARDFEADDLIQKNRDNGIERSGFLNKDGKKRTKIDDL